MASVGQLAAGVAHEINNPVGFVKSNLGTLGEYSKVLIDLVEKYEAFRSEVLANNNLKAIELADKISDLREEDDLEFMVEDLDSLLTESIDGTARIKEIVQNLKSFARVDESDTQKVNLNECIDTTINIAWNELKYNCEIKKEYNELPEILCNSGKINQVILNMLINASHAIDGKGIITIRTRHDQENVILEIEDTGRGISEEDQKRLFDPFFTTKPTGVGTGLGLSISHGIINEHDGSIEVESTIGAGTLFRIILPVNNEGLS
jgi:signal transduction histidine kinase